MEGNNMTTRIENIIERLNAAYGTSTRNTNKFADLVNSIAWDDIFQADGETYYILEDLTLTVENLNTFEQNWKPSVMVGTFFKELGWL